MENRFGRAFADAARDAAVAVAEIHAAHARLGGEGDELGVGRGDVAPAQAVFFLGEHGDGAAFGGFVGQRSQLGGVGQFLDFDARRGNEFRGHAVAEGDGAGFVKQQHVHVARRLDGAAAGGQDVAAHQAVNAGDADGAEQAADGGGNQADDQRQQHRGRKSGRRPFARPGASL